MRDRRILVATIFTLLTQVGVVPHAMARPEAFVISQRHCFVGKWQIFINGTRVKAVNLNDGYCIVTMAPTWKVVFYREDGKRMHEMPMKTFLTFGLSISGGYVVEGQIKRAHRNECRYKGLRTTEFIWPRMEREVSSLSGPGRQDYRESHLSPSQNIGCVLSYRMTKTFVISYKSFCLCRKQMVIRLSLSMSTPIP